MAKLAAKSCPYRPLSEYVYRVVTSKRRKQNKTKIGKNRKRKKLYQVKDQLYLNSINTRNGLQTSAVRVCSVRHHCTSSTFEKHLDAPKV